MAELLWLDPVGGAAGDMFLAAALDLGVDRPALERMLGSLPLGGWRLEVAPAQDGALRGLHLDVRVEAPQPGVRGYSDVVACVRRSGLPPRARDAALALFDRIGRAEAKVHGVALDAVHFHEVGAVDSIVDLCGAAAALELLGWPRAVASPPELGHGLQRTEHGVLPVPPPAVLEILSGTPVRPGGPPGEAVTPTGAAILAVLFEVGAAPPFTPRRTGHGVGTSRWPDRPNVLRLTLGEESGPQETLFLLEANLDDATGQLVARAIEVALERGAVDAWAVPATMKKGRPGLVLSALAPGARRDVVARALAEETTTLGVRWRPVERLELGRSFETVETEFGAVRVKVGRLGGEVLNAHPEWDDCAVRAREHGVPVKRVLEAAAAAWRRR